MRTAILWNTLTGYLNACFRSLAAIPGNELFVAHQRATARAPFDESQFNWIGSQFVFDDKPDEQALLDRVRKFNPDLLMVASWNRAAYRRVCHAMRGRAIRVCCMDNQWRSTPKQWLGVLTAPIFMRRLFDVAFVAGERQAQFARKLGFGEEQIWRGFLSCDHDRFYDAAQKKPKDRSEAFLYVGHLGKGKGVDVLLDAYEKYRKQCSRPWELWVAGAGEMRKRIEAANGVMYRGFVQPDNIPSLFAAASCLVLPSRSEHWGVVIHEATAAGLLVICTDNCGAAVHLVQDGYNGMITQAGDVNGLTRAMLRTSSLSQPRLVAMSEASVALSWQFTPARWGQYLTERT